MPKTKKAVKAAEPKIAGAAAHEIATAVKPEKAKAVKTKAVKPKKAKAAKPKVKRAAKPKAKKAAKPKGSKVAKPKAAKAPKVAVEQKAELLSSEVVFEGPLFRVLRDRLIEPGGMRKFATSSATTAAWSSWPSTIRKARKIPGS